MANRKFQDFGVRGPRVRIRQNTRPTEARIPKPESRARRLPFALCHLKFSFRPLHPQHLTRLHRLQLVNQKFSIRGQGDEEMGQRGRGRPHDLGSLRCELAPVTGAGNLIGLRLPLSDAAEVRAHRRDRVEPSCRPHDVSLLVLNVSHRVDGEQIGAAGAKRR